ncbi:MAG: class I SAM-dependent methyltransferase [Nannocystaceae bacterium]
MQTAWDYTHLARAYVKRPNYSESVIQRLVEDAQPTSRACDVGAGVGHLTRMLGAHGLHVTAVEPNDAMRAIGQVQTDPGVAWVEGTGEATGQPAGTFELVTFGSSFNVTDRKAALLEVRRILRPGGTFACLWNHRDLDDPIQARIEAIIGEHVPNYDYGTRRSDQTDVINASGLFEPPHYTEGTVVHRQAVTDVVEAWKSHATLARQAGEKGPAIIAEIGRYLLGRGTEAVDVPYTTRMWSARLRSVAAVD